MLHVACLWSGDKIKRKVREGGIDVDEGDDIDKTTSIKRLWSLSLVVVMT